MSAPRRFLDDDYEQPTDPHWPEPTRPERMPLTDWVPGTGLLVIVVIVGLSGLVDAL